MNTTRTILIVDDNELNRQVLERRLLKAGFAVLNADSGGAALDISASHQVDLVLLDYEMPVMSGMEVLKELRQRYTAVELPVIMVTARHESEDIVLALESGANDYVTKPLDFAVAMARIRTQLTLKQLDEARRESEERYALAMAGSNDGIWDWDLRANSAFYSARWKMMLGIEGDNIRGKPEDWLDRVHPEDRGRVDADLQAHLQDTDSQFENEHRVLHRDGTYRWVLVRGLAVRDKAGKPYRIAGSQTDITEGKIADPLTGLPNRLLFIDRLSRLAERAKRRKDLLFAVLFLDLDRFKIINDSYGHAVGDQLLIAFARRMERSLRSTDTVSRFQDSTTLARLGGDEFTILLDDLRNPSDAQRVADRLLEALRQPFSIAGHEIYANASIGIALSSSGYEKPEELLQDADTAMYRAKTTQPGTSEIFDSEMRASAVARLQLETDMRHALERRELSNWYQLIVSLETGRLRGFEALVRWEHPSRGLLLPGDFIGIAEETGLIIPVGLNVLSEACRQTWAWQQLRGEGEPLLVAVNLSVRQFGQAALVDQIQEALAGTGLSPNSLKLEITETMVMHDPEKARRILKDLKKIGVRIGIDDFGTGYSSLSYLHAFPLDTLKIDKSFVGQMESDPDKLEIVKTIVSLAHNLGLEVIAEGVENAQQMLMLRDLGCEFAQGYLFSRPVHAPAAGDLMAANPDWLARALQVAETTTV